jgi:hypothetical protein
MQVQAGYEEQDTGDSTAQCLAKRNIHYRALLSRLRRTACG